MEGISFIALIPPAARTETSAAVVWHKLEQAETVFCYHIYLNDKLEGITTATDYTFKKLESGRSYNAYVAAVSKNGHVLAKSAYYSFDTPPKGELFDITSFGAAGDGETLNTKAIQAAIDACAPGGKVYVPEGRFLTGALFLKSHMTLELAKGAYLLGSGDTDDYPLMTCRWEGRETLCYASLLNTRDTDGQPLSHISIVGEGVIDANGEALFPKEMEEKKGARGRAICLRNAEYVYLKDITVRNSPAWCVHLIYCNHVSVNNVSIHTKYDETGRRYRGIFNGDGLDPDSCGDVYIFHSTIASQDDCIAIKSGRDGEGRKVGIPSQDIRITNCVFKSGFGVAIGSEMSGGVKNVWVQDCVYENTFSIGTVKAPRGRGGVVENITFSDCVLKNHNWEHQDCKWFRGAINVDQFYSHDDFDWEKKEESGEETPVFRHIAFRNIVLDTVGGNAIFLAGLPESPLVDIRLENVQAIGNFGLKAYNIKGLALENTTVFPRNSEPVETYNIAPY